jgi:hypothetical protein
MIEKSCNGGFSLATAADASGFTTLKTWRA